MTETTLAPPANVNRVPLYALLLAASVSLIGDSLTIIALPWFVLQTTGSATLTGIAAFATGLPALLAGIFGGTLVDRLGYRQTAIVAEIVGGFGILLLPVLYSLGVLAFWHVLVCGFVGSLLQIPGLSARRSMLPELAEVAGIRLERVNSWFESLHSLGMLLGPPLAGVLITTIGAANVLWIDAASFFIAAALVLTLIPARLLQPPAPSTNNYLDDLLQGLRFLKNHNLLLALAVTLMLTNLIFNPFFVILLPIFVNSYGGAASDVGLLWAVYGAGELTGALLYGSYGQRFRRRSLWLVSYAVSSLMIWVVLATTQLWALLVIFLIGGLLIGPTNPLLVTVRLERIPATMRGRVFGTFSAIAMAAAPIGFAITGAAVDWSSLQTTLLGVAVLYTALSIAMFFVPAFHNMEAVAQED
jgi:MFS family permease